MTVAEMIEALNKMPPNARLVFVEFSGFTSAIGNPRIAVVGEEEGIYYGNPQAYKKGEIIVTI